MAADPMVVALLAVGLVRLLGGVIGWLAARADERARSRTIVVLLCPVGGEGGRGRE